MSVNSDQSSFRKTFAETEKTDESLKFVEHRVVHGAFTNDHIADFLRKYADIQLEYGKKIDHLIKKTHPSSADLATFEESWNAFLQVIATQGLAAYNIGTEIKKTEEPTVRNLKDRKETHQILDGLHADSKTLSQVSYKGKVLNAMDKLQDIDEHRLERLSESIGQVGTSLASASKDIAAASDKLNDKLATFSPKQDVESYLGQVVAGDIRFPDLSPANSAGYSDGSLNRYASPQLSPTHSQGLRPTASPLELNQQNKESRLKKFFTGSK